MGTGPVSPAFKDLPLLQRRRIERNAVAWAHRQLFLDGEPGGLKARLDRVSSAAPWQDWSKLGIAFLPGDLVAVEFVRRDDADFNQRTDEEKESGYVAGRTIAYEKGRGRRMSDERHGSLRQDETKLRKQVELCRGVRIAMRKIRHVLAHARGRDARAARVLNELTNLIHALNEAKDLDAGEKAAFRKAVLQVAARLKEEAVVTHEFRDVAVRKLLEASERLEANPGIAGTKVVAAKDRVLGYLKRVTPRVINKNDPRLTALAAEVEYEKKCLPLVKDAITTVLVAMAHAQDEIVRWRALAAIVERATPGLDAPEREALARHFLQGSALAFDHHEISESLHDALTGDSFPLEKPTEFYQQSPIALLFSSELLERAATLCYCAGAALPKGDRLGQAVQHLQKAGLLLKPYSENPANSRMHASPANGQASGDGRTNGQTANPPLPAVKPAMAQAQLAMTKIVEYEAFVIQSELDRLAEKAGLIPRKRAKKPGKKKPVPPEGPGS